MKKKIDNTGQLDFFELLRKVQQGQAEIFQGNEAPGCLNIDAQIRGLVTQALKQTSLSRYEVAGKMSELIGKEITKAMIDSWSAESKENHRFPLAYLPAFCRATGSREILRFLADKCGGFYIESAEALYTELGRIEQQKKELLEKEKTIKMMIQRLKG
jgi:hypothetical protein